MRAARLLDGDGHIDEVRNNYTDLSFNVGPTLHRWMASNAEDVDSAIREAGAATHGTGRVLAQPWVHVILPLANPDDRATLMRWGVTDYQARFGHAPEGAWLPETAADVDTLEALAEVGISATILAPQQAHRVRPLVGAAAGAAAAGAAAAGEEGGGVEEIGRAPG